jgi:hypothetical protein
MKVTAEKVPIAWELQLTIRALHPEWVELREVIKDNITFCPALKPLLEELNLAIDGWRAPIEGPCGSDSSKPLIVFDETLNRVVEIDKNQLGVYGK